MAFSESISVASLPRPRIRVIETRIPGCYELQPTVLDDSRGSFAKIFHRPLWEELGLCTDFPEEYVTRSLPGTLRGLHFQLPPIHHHKVVTCLKGRAWDVAVDLRKDSPAYGEYIAVNLADSLTNALYLPPGVAHGFCVTGAEAILYYKVSTVYSPAHDAGIRWDSCNIPWPVALPTISERDRALPPFSAFETPFILSSSGSSR